MDWTSKKPFTEGFYWYKFPNSNDFTIIEVIISGDIEMFKNDKAFFFGLEDSKLLSSLKGTFLGPLNLHY